MPEQRNAAFDLVLMQQAVEMRNLVRFGVVMAVALAGQILVTILFGSFAWAQQYIILLVVAELLWWPPLFCILYFSFIEVVKLVKHSISSQKLIQRQFAELSEEYQRHAAIYETRIREKDIYLRRFQIASRERIRAVRMESIPGTPKLAAVDETRTQEKDHKDRYLRRIQLATREKLRAVRMEPIPRTQRQKQST